MLTIAIDCQYDFTRPEGACYAAPRPSCGFIRETLIPFYQEHGLAMAEIRSDYRQPRTGRSDNCHPGAFGGRSEIPEALLVCPPWYKCMHSPLWTRENIGVEGPAGWPYQDPERFNAWLERAGATGQDIVLFGLTLDCCVMCTAQELYWRGHKVSVLVEATDLYSGDQQEKEHVLTHRPLSMWAQPMAWGEYKERALAAR